MFAAFPLLFIVLAVFNVVALLVSGPETSLFDAHLFNIPLKSGDSWASTLGDLFLTLALALLLLELVKAIKTYRYSILSHGLSIGVFVVCLVEFLTVNGFGNSTFFFITCVALLNAIAGFTITIRAMHRKNVFAK